CNDFRSYYMQIFTGDRLQCVKSVLHPDQRPLVLFINFMFCERKGCAFLKCIIYEPVPICIFSQKRDEEVSFFYCTGVYGHTFHFFIFNCFSSFVGLSIAKFCNLPYCHFYHKKLPFLLFIISSRESSTL